MKAASIVLISLSSFILGSITLLADLVDPTALKPWLDLLVGYGVPLIVTFFVMYLAWKYVPPFIDSAINTPTAIRELTGTLEKAITATREIQLDSNAAREDVDSLKRAGFHLANGAEKLVKSITSTHKIDSDVQTEFRNAKEVLRYVHRKRERDSDEGNG